MPRLKKILTGVVIGGWALAVLAGNAMAQSDTEGAGLGDSSARGDWQQRVLRRGRANHSSLYQTPKPEYRSARRPQPPTRPMMKMVSDAVATEQEDTYLDSEPSQLTPLPESEVYDPMDLDGHGMAPYDPYCGGGDCGAGCGDCGDGYGDGGGYPCYGAFGPHYGVRGAMRAMGYYLHQSWWARDMSLFAGVHGFKGPIDQGQNGNFGLHYGVNFGSPMGIVPGLAYQVGFAGVHSDLSGHRAAGVVDTADRRQFFLTAGIFRRVPCAGIQWGVAFDVVHEDYYDWADLRQIRSETGYVFADGCREIGYFGAYGVNEDLININPATVRLLRPTDMFAFYYRRYFSEGGDGRFWGGFTGSGDALLGADLRVPLGHGWAIENRINYLIPKEGRGTGQAEESWGLNIQLVWYLGQPARCALRSPYRPLLGVADNTVFMADASPP